MNEEKAVGRRKVKHPDRMTPRHPIGFLKQQKRWDAAKYSDRVKDAPIG
jgi:hypothetical protein